MSSPLPPDCLRGAFLAAPQFLSSSAAEPVWCDRRGDGCLQLLGHAFRTEAEVLAFHDAAARSEGGPRLAQPVAGTVRSTGHLAAVSAAPRRFRGVHKSVNGRYTAKSFSRGTSRHLGTFHSAEEAARAYDAAVRAAGGRTVNFVLHAGEEQAKPRQNPLNRKGQPALLRVAPAPAAAPAHQRAASEDAAPRRCDAQRGAPSAVGEATARSLCLSAVTDGAEYQALLETFPGTDFAQLVGLRNQHGSLAAVGAVLAGERPGTPVPQHLPLLSPGYAALFLEMMTRPAEPSLHSPWCSPTAGAAREARARAALAKQQMELVLSGAQRLAVATAPQAGCSAEPLLYEGVEHSRGTLGCFQAELGAVLGDTFRTQEEAAHAYDAEVRHRGGIYVNFPVIPGEVKVGRAGVAEPPLRRRAEAVRSQQPGSTRQHAGHAAEPHQLQLTRPLRPGRAQAAPPADTAALSLPAALQFFRGVRLRPRGKFSAEIHLNGRTVHLGTFDAAEEAAHAHDDAVRAAGGCVVNFVQRDGERQAVPRKTAGRARALPKSAPVNGSLRPAEAPLPSRSQFKGVTLRDGKWYAQIYCNGASKGLGHHATAEEAARAYDTAVRQNHGCVVNFVLNEGEVQAVFGQVSRLTLQQRASGRADAAAEPLPKRWRAIRASTAAKLVHPGQDSAPLAVLPGLDSVLLESLHGQFGTPAAVRSALSRAGAQQGLALVSAGYDALFGALLARPCVADV